MARIDDQVGNSRNYHYGVGMEVIVRICQTLAHVFHTVIGPRASPPYSLADYPPITGLLKYVNRPRLTAESGEIGVLCRIIGRVRRDKPGVSPLNTVHVMQRSVYTVPQSSRCVILAIHESSVTAWRW